MLQLVAPRQGPTLSAESCKWSAHFLTAPAGTNPAGAFCFPREHIGLKRRWGRTGNNWAVLDVSGKAGLMRGRDGGGETPEP